MRRLLQTSIVLIAMCLSAIATIHAQTLTGTVIDESELPVIGATASIAGTTIGTITDIDGNYTLEGIEDGASIEFRYIGMITQTIIYKGQKTINVTLKADSEMLEEVVVVGFGSQKKVNLTGSVAVVDSEVLQSRPVSTAAEMLQGVVPGLNITNSAGTSMNTNPSINIRGTGTIGSGSTGSPLILIDGMEGDFASLNPQDIESISVLKDVASSSIYGSRAPFGVILITTKKGSEGRASFNYNNNFRFSTPSNMPKMMDSYSYALFINDANINSGNGQYFNQDRIDDILAFQRGEIKQAQQPDPDDPNFWGEGYVYGIGNTDHFDDAFQKWIFAQEHNASLSGGSGKVNYYVSANFSDSEGYLEVNTDKVKRLSTTAKINAKITDWFSLVSSTRYANKTYDYPTNLTKEKFAWSKGRPGFFGNLGSWPLAPNYDPNGNLYASTARDVGNSVFSLAGGDSSTDDQYLYQQFKAIFEPIKGWKTVIDYNFNLKYTQNTRQLKNTYNIGVDNKTLYPVCKDSYVDETRYNSSYYNFNAYSEYSKTLNEEHNYKVMVGFQTEGSSFGSMSAKRDGLIVDDLVSLDVTSGLSNAGLALSPTVGGSYSDWATAGFFGRANYDYKGRYLAEVSLRYDGTSRFVGDQRWGLFPSGSLGWNIARENFFEPLSDKISNLKLRASYGQLGNQNTNNLYPTFRVMNIQISKGAYLLNGLKPTITTEPALIDPSLTWERIVNWNAGFDVSMFNNRLNIVGDYFVRKTTDMVGPAPELPSVFGINVPKQNNTDLTTRGYEVSITWRDLLENGFAYGLSASLSDSKTIIDSYPNANGLLNTYISGREIGEIWGYETIGIAKSDEEMQEHLKTTDQKTLGANWTAGDIMYKDLNGDGKINKGANTIDNHGDLKIIGNNSPRYTVSFSADASYKGFDIRAFFQGVLKRDYWLGGNSSNQGGEFFWGAYKGIWDTRALVQHLDYFRSEGDHPLGQNLNSYYPRPTFDKKFKNTQPQTRYLQDASYLRLKNLQLGYTIPKQIAAKAAMSNCRIFVSIENLLTFSSLPDIYDPETVSGGYFGLGYPVSKTASIGLNVTF